MATNNNIIDGSGKGYKAKVSSRGELYVAPINYSSSYPATVDAANTAFNLISPKSGKNFVVTGFILTANNSVSPITPATVILYGASSAESTTIVEEIFTIEILQNSYRDILPMNIITSEGLFINIKTTDPTINTTLLGFFIDA